MSQPTFTGLHFWVRDMKASLAFYRAIGLEADDVADDEELARIRLPNGLTLALGTHALTRRYDPGFSEPPAGSRGSMALQFDLPSRRAVDDLFGKLISARYDAHLAPFDAFWGNRYCEVLDPDGNTVGFHGAD